MKPARPRIADWIRIAAAVAATTLGFAAIALTVGTLTPNKLARMRNGAAVPNVTFNDEAGTPVSLDAFRGKIVVLNLWAAWCAPCVKELPAFARMAAQLPKDHYAAIAVDMDKGGARVARTLLDSINVRNLAVYASADGHLARDLDVRGFPTTFIVDQDGLLLERREGPVEWDGPRALSYLNGLSHGN